MNVVVTGQIGSGGGGAKSGGKKSALSDSVPPFYSQTLAQEKSI